MSIVEEQGFKLGDPGLKLLNAMFSASSRTNVKKGILSYIWRLESAFQAPWVKHTFVETTEHVG